MRYRIADRTAAWQPIPAALKSTGHQSCRIKQFRRIATRYEKTDTSFAGMIDLVAVFVAIR